MSNYNAFQKVYWREVMAETSCLSAMEFGAYIAMCAAYWANAKPLPLDGSKLARAARVTNEEWTAVSPTVLEFFRADGEVLRHDKLDAALIEAKEAHAKAVAKGKTGAQVRWGSSEDSSGIAQACPDYSRTNARAIATRTRTRTRTNNNHTTCDTPQHEGFEEFWDAFGKHGGKKAAIIAYDAALKRHGVTPSEILTGAKRYRNHILQRGELQFQKHAQGWLNESMWESQNLLPLEPAKSGWGRAVF